MIPCLTQSCSCSAQHLKRGSIPYIHKKPTLCHLLGQHTGMHWEQKQIISPREPGSGSSALVSLWPSVPCLVFRTHSFLVCSVGVIRPLLHKTIIGIKINLHKAIAAGLLFAISRTKERVGVLPWVTQLSGKKKKKTRTSWTFLPPSQGPAPLSRANVRF